MLNKELVPICTGGDGDGGGQIVLNTTVLLASSLGGVARLTRSGPQAFGSTSHGDHKYVRMESGADASGQTLYTAIAHTIRVTYMCAQVVSRPVVAAELK